MLCSLLAACGSAPAPKVEVATLNDSDSSRQSVAEYDSTEYLSDETSGLSFAYRTIDLGAMTRDTRFDTVFVFRNDNPNPIVILKASTACSCARTDYDKHPVEAGAEGRLVIHISADKPGVFRKKVFMYTSAATKPVELMLQGEIR